MDHSACSIRFHAALLPFCTLTSFVVLSDVHCQGDANTIRGCETVVQCPRRPRVVIFSYVAFVNPSRRFGLFAGESFGARRGLTEEFPVLSVGECVGSYGGMVCDPEEALDRDGLYTYRTPKLPPRATKGTTYVHYVVHVCNDNQRTCLLRRR